MMTSKSKKPRWGAMTAAELAEATKEFDHPLPQSRYKPATKAQRARFERALRAGARGRELLKTLKLDPKLIGEAEAYAKRMKITVNQVIALGIRAVVGSKRTSRSS